MNLAQAKRHLPFRPLEEEGKFDLCGPYGWLPCDDKQNAFLVALPEEERLPLGPFYRKAGHYGKAAAVEAFEMFIVEGIRR